MRGVVSEAMVMCASSVEKIEILDPPSLCVPGDRVTFEGYTGVFLVPPPVLAYNTTID